MRSTVIVALCLLTAVVGAQTIRDDVPARVGFVDISTTGGTAIANVGDDTSHAIVTTVGNALFPAGNVLIGSNGIAIAGLNGGYIDWLNESIAGPGVPAFLPPGGSGYLLPCWDDQFANPAHKSSTIYWQETDNVLYIMWKNILHFGSPYDPSEAITFELQVFGDAGCGPFVQYFYPDTTYAAGDPENDGASATVGYLNGTNVAFANHEHSFNTPGAIFTGLVLSIVPNGFALPVVSNDDCLAPIQLNYGFNGLFNNGSATDGCVVSPPGCPNGISTGFNDLWFSLSAGCTGFVTINTSNGAGSLDTLLEAYAFCGGTALTCDDDSGAGLGSQINFPVDAGQTYLIRVSGFSPVDVGNFPINVDGAGGFVFGFSSPNGAGSLQMDVNQSTCGGGYFIAITLNEGNFPNGAFFGIDIPFVDLLNELAIGFPFVGPLNVHTTVGPIDGLPPVTLYAVGVSLPYTGAHTPPQQYTIP